MRAGDLTLTILAGALATSCFGGSPAAMRDLTSLPADQDKRHEQMESTLARPGDREDVRKPLSGKLRKVETVAATAATVLGILFSTSENVHLGTETFFDESSIFGPGGPRDRGDPAKHDANDEGEDAARAPAPPNDDGHLVPWIRFSPTPN